MHKCRNSFQNNPTTIFFTVHYELELVGLRFNKYKKLASTVAQSYDNAGVGIFHFDVLRSHHGLPCLDKRNFDTITGRAERRFLYMHPWAYVHPVVWDPAAMNGLALAFREATNKAVVALILGTQAKVTGLATGHCLWILMCSPWIRITSILN